MLVEQNVGTFDVTMDDVVSVDVLQTSSRPHGDVGSLAPTKSWRVTCNKHVVKDVSTWLNILTRG